MYRYDKRFGDFLSTTYYRFWSLIGLFGKNLSLFYSFNVWLWLEQLFFWPPPSLHPSGISLSLYVRHICIPDHNCMSLWPRKIQTSQRLTSSSSSSLLKRCCDPCVHSLSASSSLHKAYMYIYIYINNNALSRFGEVHDHRRRTGGERGKLP